jgi:hypothetical protein
VPYYTTPSAAGGNVADIGGPTAAANPVLPSETSGAGAASQRRNTFDAVRDVGRAGQRDGGNGGVPLWWSVAGLIVLAGLCVPVAVRWFTRRRRWRTARTVDDAARAAWAELRADAVDHGLVWERSESPRAAARRIAENLELGAAAADALTRIARAEERARYARSPADTDTLRADGRLVRRSFAASVSRAARWRARLLPPSTVAAARDALAWVLDGLGLRDAVPERDRTARIPG